MKIWQLLLVYGGVFTVPTNMQPLFIVTGASCAGKSTLCNELFLKEEDYIVMESDLLWNDVYNTPEDDYREYRSVLMKVCATISQIGKPVVLCGCAVPKQFENQFERKYFSAIHYLAVVCDDECLEKRMCTGREVDDENWIKSSVDFNNWLKTNASETMPPITLLDTSNLTPSEAAKIADEWIKSLMSQ